MSTPSDNLLSALRDDLPGGEVNVLIDRLRTLPPASVLNIAAQGGLSITGDGNIVGDNNVAIVVKGEGAAELAALLREAYQRGRALHQLRAPLSDFVGREAEIERLTRELRYSGRLAIGGINGMGGMGKTELALQVADRLRCDYNDAQLFVDLRGTHSAPRDPEDALGSCIRAFLGLEAKLPDNREELIRVYRSVLDGKRALILLDNAANRDQVLPLLPPRGCALLVTSRSSILLPGMETVALEQLNPQEAARLLLEVAPRVSPEISDRICRLCGFLPLAVRAAASLLAVTVDLEPQHYEAVLRVERTRLENIGSEGVEVGVEASLSLSYARLEAEAARVFRQLSVFPASFDAAAEKNICEEVDHKHLSGLVRRSLVIFDSLTKRYRLHDLARLFAAKQMDEAECTASRSRYAKHYEIVLRTANELYLEGGESLTRGLLLLDLEWLNVQTGQAWAAERAQEEDWAAALCSRYREAGGYVLDLLQHPREQIRWREAAISATQRLKLRNAEAGHLRSLGNSYYAMGDSRRAIDLFETALVVFRENRDRSGEGQTLNNLANARFALGELRLSRVLFEEALPILRETGNRRVAGYALNNLGHTLQALGQFSDAIEHHELSVSLAREIGDQEQEGAALGGLGLAYCAMGDVQRAIQCHEEHLRSSRTLRSRTGEAKALNNLGNAYLAIGELERAITQYEQALAFQREMLDRRGEGKTLWNLALVMKRRGNCTQAIVYAEAALDLYEQTENPQADHVRRQLAEWQHDSARRRQI